MASEPPEDTASTAAKVFRKVGAEVGGDQRVQRLGALVVGGDGDAGRAVSERAGKAWTEVARDQWRIAG